MRREHRHPQGPDWARWNQWLLCLGLAAAVSWLVLRHGAHLREIAPFLILLACPLMHLFGHGHGSSTDKTSATTDDPPLGNDHQPQPVVPAKDRPARSSDTEDLRT